MAKWSALVDWLRIRGSDGATARFQNAGLDAPGDGNFYTETLKTLEVMDFYRPLISDLPSLDPIIQVACTATLMDHS